MAVNIEVITRLINIKYWAEEYRIKTGGKWGVTNERAQQEMLVVMGPGDRTKAYGTKVLGPTENYAGGGGFLILFGN